MAHHPIDRFDFDYWPPMPIEAVGVQPLRPATGDELCDGLLYVPDVQRCKAIHASGDWLDIQDFWIVANPPQDHAMAPEQDFTQFDTFLRFPKQVSGRYHLAPATRAFNGLVKEIAFCALQEVKSKAMDDAAFARTPLYKWLLRNVIKPAFAENKRQFILLDRTVLEDINSGVSLLPPTAGAKAVQLYGRVLSGYTTFETLDLDQEARLLSEEL